MSAKYRYPGLGYFEATDDDIFFGRDREIADLQTMVVQEKATVLYSKPGLGKISLLLAGVLPAIRRNLSRDDQKKAIVNAYIIRFHTYRSGDTVTLNDTINAAVCRSEMSNGLRNLNNYPLPENESPIWAHFKSHELTAKPDEKLLFVLIIDHLEEIFTYPDSEIRWFKQFLAELLDEYAPKKIREVLEKEELEDDSVFDKNTFRILQRELPVKLVFSLPSDKYYLINRLRDVLPNIIKSVYELGPMVERQARAAIDNPASLPQEVSAISGDAFKYKTPSFSFSEAARDEIIDFLATRSGKESEKEIKLIDTCGLQIICSFCEKKYIMEKKQNFISISDVLSLDEMIKEYYLETLQDLGLKEEDMKLVYDLLERKMIYEEDRSRLIMYEKIILNECRIKPEILEKLKRSRLIKEEAYGLGGISFEISSKILVNPILLAKTSRNGGASEKPMEYVIAEDLKKLNINIQKNAAGEKFSEALEDEPPDSYSMANIFRVMVEEKKMEEAFELLGKIKNVSSDIIVACNSLKDYYYNDRNYERARVVCSRLLENTPLDINLLITLALCYYYDENYKNALRVFEVIRKIDDKSVSNYINVALVYAEYKEWGKAYENCNIARKLDPENITVARNLGVWYKQNKDFRNAILEFENYEKYCLSKSVEQEINTQGEIGACYLEIGEYDKAIAALKNGILFNPDAGYVYKSLAATYLKKSDLENAFRNLCLAIQHNAPDLRAEDYKELIGAFEAMEKDGKISTNDLSPAELDSLGLSYEYGVLYDKAEMMYKLAVAKSPDFYLPHINLGYLNETRKKTKEALTWYEAANLLNPGNFDSLFRIAGCYYDLKMMDKSEEYYKKAGLVYKDDPNVLLGLGNIEVYRCNYTQARSFYNKSQENGGEKKVIQNNLGAVSQGLGFLDLAIEHDREAIKLDSLYELPLVNLACAYCDKREYGKAFENLSNALKLEESDIYIHMNFANLYRKLNAFPKALESFNRCMDIDPNDEDYLSNLGRYYFDLQQFDLADQQVQKALKTNPTHKSTMILAAKLCRINNQFDEAFKWLDQASGLDKGDHLPKFHQAKLHFYFKRLEETGNLLEELSAISFESSNLLTPLINELYGDWFKEKGQTDQAAAYYSKALKDNPRKESLVGKMIALEKNRNGLLKAKNYEDYLNNLLKRRKLETRAWIK